MDSLYTKAHIRESLDPQPSTPEQDMQWLAGASAEVMSPGARLDFRAPRAGGRARSPGGARFRIDGAADPACRDAQGSCRPDQLSRRAHRARGRGCVARGAARGPRGDRSVGEFRGIRRLPAGSLSHHRISGDAGGRLRQSGLSSCGSPRPKFTMCSKCRSTSYLDAANHKSRRRKLGGVTIEVYDIPYGERNIWGATAGMLMTLRRMLQSQRATRAAMTARPAGAANCSPSWSACARPTAVPGTGNRPLRASRRTPSRRPTKSPMPSSAATCATSRTNWAICCSKWCSMRRSRSEADEFDFDAVAGGDLRQAVAPPSARIRRRRAADRRRAERRVGGDQGRRTQRRAGTASTSSGRRAAGAAGSDARFQAQQAGRPRGIRFRTREPDRGQGRRGTRGGARGAARSRARPGARDPAGAAAIFEEVGDLLFAAANLARKLDVDAEAALRVGERQVRAAFPRHGILGGTARRGFRELKLDAQERLWQEVKRGE